jgi:murein DD-endopeptidase MepM/ murein hydrolase activator NlpD
MDIESSRRRAIARAASIVSLAGMLGACAQTGPAPVYVRNTAPAVPVSVLAPAPLPPRTTVTVRSGQSLNRIALDHHVRASAIVAANGLKPPYELKAGMRLVIPTMAPPPVRQAMAETSSASPRVAPPTPLPPSRPETLTPPQRQAATQAPLSPPNVVAPPAAPQATPDIIPLDGPPPKQTAALPVAPRPPQTAAAAPPPQTAAAAPPSVLPPRNAAAALPLPGEASVDWGSADSTQASAAGNASGRFPWPVRGRILASYGSTTGGGHNDGINIAAPRGTPVRAIDTGTVAYVGNEMKGYGNLVLIKHANGWISAYAHLDELSVKLGDKITAGEVIAKVGDTGGVAEPQLHFELRRGKKPVDPREFLAPAPSAAAPAGNKAG